MYVSAENKISMLTRLRGLRLQVGVVRYIV